MSIAIPIRLMRRHLARRAPAGRMPGAEIPTAFGSTSRGGKWAIAAIPAVFIGVLGFLVWRALISMHP